MIVYISGPMTGIEDFNKPEFRKQAHRERMRGNIALNPAALPLGLTYESYMDIAMAQIRACNEIVVLKGFSDSKGCMAEIAYAQALGKSMRLAT